MGVVPSCSLPWTTEARGGQKSLANLLTAARGNDGGPPSRRRVPRSKMRRVALVLSCVLLVGTTSLLRAVAARAADVASLSFVEAVGGTPPTLVTHADGSPPAGGWPLANGDPRHRVSRRISRDGFPRRHRCHRSISLAVEGPYVYLEEGSGDTGRLQIFRPRLLLHFSRCSGSSRQRERRACTFGGDGSNRAGQNRVARLPLAGCLQAPTGSLRCNAAAPPRAYPGSRWIDGRG